MFDYFKYKQQLWAEYNDLFNKYAKLNDSYSVNTRLLYIDLDKSNWDSVGGSVSYWDKHLSQLKWRVYENVPLFQNAPAVTQSSGSEHTETLQNFTATIKFNVTPKPNDLLMFYDDSSATVYRITDVRFHRTIEEPLKIFECDFESAPVKTETLYERLNVISHEILNQFNYKLYDFELWMTEYQPILDNIIQIIRDTNKYFDFRNERYSIVEFNNLIKEIKTNSKLGAVTQLKTPLTLCDDSCDPVKNNPEAYEIYEKLIKIKEITC